MASKSKKRPKGRAAVDPVDCVKRSLSRGDYKQALKDARLWYRQSPTGELRCFLEHAYIGRAQQLVRSGLSDDARRIVGELLELGITEAAVEAGLPELLLSVGMLDRLPQAQNRLTEEDRKRLVIKAADRAVVKPGSTPASMKELRDEASQIRAALDAVEHGDDAAALACLKEISRQSVFADWKYFVRGLIAYYRKDRTEMEANWGRLNPDRTAVTIAAPLRVIAGIASSQQDVNLRAKIVRLEKHTAHQAVLSSLMRLRQSQAGHDWPQMVKTFRVVHSTLRELDRELYRKLIECLSGSLARDGCLDELTSLSKIADPLPLDPHWNRVKAIACENSEYVEDKSEVYWRSYLDDLADLPVFQASERSLAQGLVWLRLASSYLEDVTRYRTCRCGWDHSRDIEKAEKEAWDAFEACMAVAPEFAPAYMLAAKFHQNRNRSEEAAGVYRRLLEHVPDHVDALTRLATHHLVQGEPQQGLKYALRARQSKPLDQTTAELVWSAHLAVARDRAGSGRYDEARNELAAADRVLPLRAGNYDVLARKAVLEIKANDAGAARRLVEQAQERLEEPTALWLAIAIEGLRYGLPNHEVWLYEKRWTEALRRRCRSSTAGLMCRIVATERAMPQPLANLAKCSRHLVQYIGRCGRVKWIGVDLRDACEFLREQKEWKLVMKFAKVGIRRFPDMALFHLLKGIEDMGKGPRYRPRTIERFRRAIDLAAKSGDPADKRVMEEAKRYLQKVEDALGPGAALLDDDEQYDCDGDASGDVVHGGPLDGVPIETARKIFEMACAKFGLDPDAVMGDLQMSGRVNPNG